MQLSGLLRSLVPFLSLLRPIAADTCSLVAALNAIDLKLPSSSEYRDEQGIYWSTGCSALKPSCILFPKNNDEVAAIVQLLNDNNETFAVKSGGNSPNEGWASIQGGPLISTRKLNEVKFDRESMTVRIGPGNLWQDVHKALEGTGVTVVGGRMGKVGVGGFLLGGGLSFLSPQYGWGANNVVSYDVVLANATVVTASKTSHPDLFKALKGGGGSYGIVTSYTMMAHPIGQVWGGTMVFLGSKTNQLLAAVRDFTDNYPDQKAAIILTAQLTVFGAVDIWTMFVFYDGATPPPAAFKAFTDVGPLINGCKTRSYYDLITANNFGFLQGSIYTVTTEMIPVPSTQNGAEVLGAIHDNWKNAAKGVLGVAGLISAVAYQPIPKSQARKSREMGGDLIDLDDDVGRILYEFNNSYWFDIDDNTMDKATQQMYQGTRDLVNKFQGNGKLPEAYAPLFMNDAYFRQDYFARLRTAGFAKSVREAYDPNNFFRDRTKGWKM